MSDTGSRKEQARLLEELAGPMPAHDHGARLPHRRLAPRLLAVLSAFCIASLLVFGFLSVDTFRTASHAPVDTTSTADTLKTSSDAPLHHPPIVDASAEASARLQLLQQQLSRSHLEEDVVIKNLSAQYDLQAYRARLRGVYEQFFAPPDPLASAGPFADIWAAVEGHLDLTKPPKASAGIPHLISSSARNASDLPEAFASWQKNNRDWDRKVYDDDDIDRFFRESFAAMGHPDTPSSEHSFYERWRRLPYPILRIDTFRYLKIFLDGGVYGDSDTGGLRPVEAWPGMSGPHAKVLEKHDEVLHRLEAAPSWTQPALVLAIEYDAPGKKKLWKELKLARPLQITQFAFLAQPFHPVLLDCLGIIMDYASQYHAKPIPTEGTEFMNLILDWTGPGLFTDAVFRYLVARYGVDPFVVAGLGDNAARIGDVLIYPEFAFGIDEWHHLSPDFELVFHGFLHRWIDHFDDA